MNTVIAIGWGITATLIIVLLWFFVVDAVFDHVVSRSQGWLKASRGMVVGAILVSVTVNVLLMLWTLVLA